MFQFLSECGPPSTVNMVNCTSDGSFSYFCPFGQFLNTYPSQFVKDELIFVPKAENPHKCVSKCVKDDDCYGLTWLSGNCFHRRLDCHPKNDTNNLILNVTFHPDGNSTDFGMIKTCNHFPSGLEWSGDPWYPTAILLVDRKACVDINVYRHYLIFGDYAFANDTTSS